MTKYDLWSLKNSLEKVYMYEQTTEKRDDDFLHFKSFISIPFIFQGEYLMVLVKLLIKDLQF
jgi:hypothetical protein